MTHFIHRTRRHNGFQLYGRVKRTPMCTLSISVFIENMGNFKYERIYFILQWKKYKGLLIVSIYTRLASPKYRFINNINKKIYNVLLQWYGLWVAAAPVAKYCCYHVLKETLFGVRSEKSVEEASASSALETPADSLHS